MPLKKWTLLSTQDISPSNWFPLEKRSYRLPNNTIVDDFYITTLADVAMVVPITKQGEIVLTKQFKPGVNELLIQFPAGRLEAHHQDLTELAVDELEEEVGIKVEKDQLRQFGRCTGFSTKASEIVYFFLATECEFNSKQKLDVTENIEVLALSPQEVDHLIATNQIWCAQTVAGWELAKKKFGEEPGYNSI